MSFSVILQKFPKGMRDNEQSIQSSSNVRQGIISSTLWDMLNTSSYHACIWNYSFIDTNKFENYCAWLDSAVIADDKYNLIIMLVLEPSLS